MEELFDHAVTKWNVDLWVVLIVLLSGFFQKSYMEGFSISKKPRYDSALKTLIVSFIVSIVYIYLANRDNKDPWPMSEYFFSYFLATSLYELVIDPFRDWIVKKFNLQKADNTNIPS